MISLFQKLEFTLEAWRFMQITSCLNSSSQTILAPITEAVKHIMMLNLQHFGRCYVSETK